MSKFLFINDHPLVRKLVWVVILKLLLLTAIWWLFLRDHKVSVDEHRMTEQVFNSAPARQSQTTSEKTP